MAYKLIWTLIARKVLSRCPMIDRLTEQYADLISDFLQVLFSILFGI